MRYSPKKKPTLNPMTTNSKNTLLRFIELLTTEKNSCLLKVSNGISVGRIFIEEGTVVDAHSGDTKGEEALYEMVKWQGPVVEHTPLVENVVPSIVTPSPQLLQNLEEHAQSARGNNSASGSDDMLYIETKDHDLCLDEATMLTVQLEGQEKPEGSTYIGGRKDDFLIITTPLQQKKDMVAQGSALIKYTYNNRNWLFKSDIIEAIESPAALTFFSYPERIHFYELRKIKRSLIRVPCVLKLREKEEYFGMLTDLSNNGTLYQLKYMGNPPFADLQNGDVVKLHCLLPGVQEEQNFEATIRNIIKNSNGVRIGLEFKELSRHLYTNIETYLYNLENKE